MGEIGPTSKEERQLLEARNLDAVEKYLAALEAERPDFLITEGLILGLHRLVVNGLYDCAGSFRTALHQVTVEQATFSPAPPYAIRLAVCDLVEQHRVFVPQSTQDRIRFVAQFFHRFLQIHPFCGGNGRVARALLGILLHRVDMLPEGLTVHYYIKERKNRYMKALNEADGGDILPLELLIMESCFEAALDDKALIENLQRHDAEAGTHLSDSPLLNKNARRKMSYAELSQAIGSLARALLGPS
ncbi:MAG: Fic family protein [Chloroflexota bacterium]